LLFLWLFLCCTFLLKPNVFPYFSFVCFTVVLFWETRKFFFFLSQNQNKLITERMICVLIHAKEKVNKLQSLPNFSF
jgi:hypothetical protein